MVADLEFRGERQQCDILRPLDGHGEPALMTGTSASHTAPKILPRSWMKEPSTSDFL